MPGQVQELQVPGTPEGGTLARVLPSTLRGALAVVTEVKKIVARTGMGPKNDPCLAPDDARNLWQFFNKIEQNEKRKWRWRAFAQGTEPPMGTGDGDDPRSPANRGWGWGWTPHPRQIGDGDGDGPPIPGKSGMGPPSPSPDKSGMGMGMGIGGSVPCYGGTT